MMKQPIRVLISGAAGQIGYALIPLVATGAVFGQDQPIILHLLDIEPALDALQGVVMEIQDGSYSLVREIVATISAEEAFTDINYAILVGGFPRRKGMLRADLLARNRPIFVAAGEALENFADRNVKVLVVANPANTNCIVAATHAPSIPRENFSALTRLDMNRAKHQLASKLGVTSGDLKNVVIWGNHSKTQVPDATFASVAIDEKEENVVSALNDQEYLDGDFISTVQTRGAAVISARGLSSAMSAANAVKDHMNNWVLGSPEGEFVSMAVYSDGTHYGVAEGIMFSFPVKCSNGNYEIVDDLELTENVQNLIKLTEQELLEEKAEALAE